MAKKSAAKLKEMDAIKTNNDDTNQNNNINNNNNNNISDLNALFSSLALFGDSPVALAFSFVLLLLSIWIKLSGTILNFGTAQNDPYARLGPIPAVDPPTIFQYTLSRSLMDEMKRAYQKDGVLAVRGLIPPDLLEGLENASSLLVQEHLKAKRGKNKMKKAKKQATQFFTANHGVVFHNPPLFNSSDTSRTVEEEKINLPPFLAVAVDSLIPQVAAQLLFSSQSHYDSPWNQSLRLIRDIFLAKDDDPFVCGWHVDDFGFWPATPESPGINAWLALDDMPIENGGGFAVAVHSHNAPWRDEAHFATGASTTSPAEGFRSAQDMIDRRTGDGTCNLQTSRPHLHRRMEETKRLYTIKRGDVIFHERWIFHRTVAFHESFLRSWRAEHDEDEPPIYRRLSLRYGPGSSVIPRGYGLEPSVLWDPANAGKTADQVCQRSGPWYPKAWPSKDSAELSTLHHHVSGKLQTAYKKQEEVRREMRPLLASRARQQRESTRSTT